MSVSSGEKVETGACHVLSLTDSRVDVPALQKQTHHTHVLSLSRVVSTLFLLKVIPASCTNPPHGVLRHVTKSLNKLTNLANRRVRLGLLTQNYYKHDSAEKGNEHWDIKIFSR